MGERRFRLGVMDPLVPTVAAPEMLTRLDYVGAAAARVDSFWVPDHLNSLMPRALWTRQHSAASRLAPRIDAVFEPWTMLGRISARNRLAGLRLGTGVTDPSRRHPAVTAQAAATLNLLTRGRMILGIGAGEREANEPYGIDFSAPVARFEEALATIRTLWDSKGALVNRDSPCFPLRNAVFDLPAYRGRWPDVWVAAHGPRMLRAAGRYGDGWFPAFTQRPADYARRLEAVRAAASDAGRDPLAVTPALWMPVITGRTRDDVDEAMASPLVKSFALNASDDFYRCHGAEHPLGTGFTGALDNLPFTLDRDAALAAVERVPDAVVRDVFLCGTPDEIVDRAADWRDHGVRYLVVANQSPSQRRIGKSLASSLVFQRLLGRLKRL